MARGNGSGFDEKGKARESTVDADYLSDNVATSSDKKGKGKEKAVDEDYISDDGSTGSGNRWTSK